MKEVRQTYANLGCLGMTKVKYFRILVGGEGVGVAIADIAVIARHRA